VIRRKIFKFSKKSEEKASGRSNLTDGESRQRALKRKKKGKIPLQIQIGPALGPNVLAAPFAYSLAPPLLQAYLFPFSGRFQFLEENSISGLV
jgi:hypothetical protein